MSKHSLGLGAEECVARLDLGGGRVIRKLYSSAFEAFDPQDWGAVSLEPSYEFFCVHVRLNERLAGHLKSGSDSR